MFEKAYKSRYDYVRAIQYDGTPEMMLDMVNEYLGLAEYYGILYIDNTDGQEIWEGDWVLIQDGRAKAVISNDYFDAIYTQVKLEEYNENTGTKPAWEDNKGGHNNGNSDSSDTDDNTLTTHDFREIDRAND